MWRSLGRSAALALLLAATAAVAEDVAFDVPIEHGEVPQDRRLIRVKQFDVVTLRWTTDTPIDIHLHGYDIEKKIVPGAVTEMTFAARATGRFTVAPHIGAQRSGGHAHGKPLVTVEVYPR
jgi:hypothetical protein